MITAEKACLENMVLYTYSMDKDVEINSINNSNPVKENQKDLGLNKMIKQHKVFRS